MERARGAGRRTRLAAVAILLATFVAGGLAGMAFERTRAGDPAPRPGRGGGPGPPAGVFAPGSPLVERLDLSPEQRERVEAILREDRQKARAAMQEMQPRLRARFDSTQAAVREVLTPAQREEFDRIQAERRERLRERFGRPRGRGRGAFPG